MRIYRSNPMDAVKRGPDMRGPLLFGAAAAAVLAAFGIWAERTVTAARADHVAAAVAAQGFGPARVTAAKGGCGRARGLYRWETPSAQGTACAGPRDRVELREARPR